MMKPTPYLIGREGQDVFLQVGSNRLTFDYQTALRVGAVIVHEAKQAKREAGDMSIHAIGLGTLTDANLDELKAQKRKDGTALYR
jgi:hypothetical protein